MLSLASSQTISMRLFFKLTEYLLVVLLIGSTMQVFGQSEMTDSSATCISSWKKGETKTFLIRHLKEKYEAEKLTSKNNFSYLANVVVLDSLGSGYTIQWVFHLPEAAKKINPLIGDSLPVFEGMKMIYRISEVGVFVELINWEEVRDTYIRMTEISLPKNMDSTARLVMEKTKELFSTKQVVESALIREIQLYHFPYGGRFTVRPTNVRSELPNPLSDEPLPAIQSYKITELNPKQDYFKLMVDQKVDLESAEKIFEGILKKMKLNADTALPEARKVLKSLEMADHHEYKIIWSTGWIKRAFYKRTARNESMVQVDSYLIEMKD